MPRVAGVGRTKKKHKTPAEVAVQVEAAAEGEVPAVEAQRLKRTRRSRKKALLPVPPPVHRTWEEVDEMGWSVRAASERLEEAVDRCEAAHSRHAEHLEKGTATLKRFSKLRGKDGVRSASWSAGWEATLDTMEKEEARLEGELQLRQDEVAAVECSLHKREGRVEEARIEVLAWYQHQKARPSAPSHPPPAGPHPPPATRLPPPATRHPPPATRRPPPATRHPPPTT